MIKIGKSRLILIFIPDINLNFGVQIYTKNLSERKVMQINSIRKAKQLKRLIKFAGKFKICTRVP